MNCDSFDRALDAYLDGDLDAQTTRAFRAHAAQCRACAGELDLARQVSAGLAELSPPDCPEIVGERVRRELSRGHMPRTSPSRRVSRWSPSPSASAWGAAAALLLLAGGIAIAVSQHGQSSKRAAVRAPEGYTREETARAARQLEWALAYTGHVAQASLLDVRRDVIAKRVMLPLQDAVAALVAIERPADRSQNRDTGDPR